VVSVLACAFLAVAVSGPAPKHFDVAASFTAPSKAGETGSVNVLFSPTDPDVRINEEPAPRLKLERGQAVLVDKQKTSLGRSNGADPEKDRYLDLARPVRFPVALAPDAPKGSQEMKATVVYFYCSKREGWCRRGNADIRFTVDVR
jgi:hypothetical protein